MRSWPNSHRAKVEQVAEIIRLNDASSWRTGADLPSAAAYSDAELGERSSALGVCRWFVTECPLAYSTNPFAMRRSRACLLSASRFSANFTLHPPTISH